MSGKREASYTIDPNTLEQRERDQQPTPENGSNDNKTMKEERKIFKIRRPGQNDSSEHKETKVTFKLNQSQQIKPSQDNLNESTKDEAKQKPVINPFANLFKADKNIFNGIGIFTSANSTNLFTSNQGTEQSATAKANPFGGQSLFTNNGANIFNNASNSIKNTSASLFPTSLPPQDQDGSGDSAQLEQVQNITSDPSKSQKTYNYEDNCPVVLTLKVAKFKKNGSELVQNVEIVLQKQKQTNIKYITIRLPATKKSIFSGVLVEKRSEVKHLHGKKQNVQVTAFYKQKNAFTKAALKLQFEKPEDGQKLYERLEQLIGSHSSQKKDEAASETAKQQKN